MRIRTRDKETEREFDKREHDKNKTKFRKALIIIFRGALCRWFHDFRVFAQAIT